MRPALLFDPYSEDPTQGLVLFSGVPEDLSINVGDSTQLNDYEFSGAFTDFTGSTVDPSGSWVETFSKDGEEVAILAAMAIWRWSSPVYINYTSYDIPGQPSPSRVGIIDSVTLSTPSGVPHLVCGWEDPDASTSCPGLVIESITMSYYGDALLCCGGALDYFGAPGGGSDEVSGADFVSVYESVLNSPYVGPVLYDPPGVQDPDGMIVELLELASRAQAAGGVLLRNSSGTLSMAR